MQFKVRSEESHNDGAKNNQETRNKLLSELNKGSNRSKYHHQIKKIYMKH